MNLTNTAKRLIELSTKATQEWKDSDEWLHDHHVGYCLHKNGCVKDSEQCSWDSEFIGEANPQTIASICKRLLELEEDKLRLDWIIENKKVIMTGVNGKFGVSVSESSGHGKYNTPREAIDAAMAQEKLR